MKNIVPITTLIIFVLALTALYILNQKTAEPEEAVLPSHKNTTYTIDSVPVTLSDGVSESVQGSGSTQTVVTRYFGNELLKDLNGDGREDVVFLLTQETGGSGTFYYVVAGLNTEAGYVGSHAFLLGDRIAPQVTQSGAGDEVQVTYAERAIGEPMTAPHSINTSRTLVLDIESMRFGEVLPDLEGEGGPSDMTLGMKRWVWQKAEYNDGQTLVPTKADAHSLTFLDTGVVEVGTDCNSVSGEYVVDEGLITFSNMRTTLMYCEGSQETEFLKLLENTQSFHFTTQGELIFELKYDSGMVTFR